MMKSGKYDKSRRNFIKTSAAAGAASVVAGSLSAGKGFAAPQKSSAESAWFDGLQYNPQISNLRTVYIHDVQMNPSIPSNWSPAEIERAVNSERVWANMDKMAVALAEESDPAAAWAKIFQKPDGKEWSETGVGIKSNTLINRSYPKAVIAEKLCLELHNLGVAYQNIYIFDSGNAGSRSNITVYNTSQNLTTWGVRITASPGGDATTDIVGSNNVMVPRYLTDGTIDILISFAVNKGHEHPSGGAYTLCLKNHVGTVKGKHDVDTAIADDVIPIYQCPEIIGQAPVYRHQLSFIDSLWSMYYGPHYGSPDHETHVLAMGIDPVILDYTFVRDIRDGMMDVVNSPHPTNWDVMNRYLSSFGYDPESPEIANLPLIDADAYVPVKGARETFGSPNDVHVIISVPGAHTKAAFHLTGQAGRFSAGIYDIKGARLAEIGNFTSNGKYRSAEWNGISSSGRPVPPGTYIVRLCAGNKTMSRPLPITKHL